MSRLRIDKFFILTGQGPGDRKMVRPWVYEWYMEDQEKLVAKALSETPFLPEKEQAA